MRSIGIKAAAAILLTALALTACSDEAPSSEIIVSLTEAEPAEYTRMAEDSKPAETTGTSAAHTTPETTSETDTVQEYETLSADAIPESIVGRWIENRLYEYTFDSDGNVAVTSAEFALNGTYAVNNEELAVTLKAESGKDQTFRFLMTAEQGGYKLERLYDKEDDSSYVPYEPTGLVSGYFSAFGGDSVFYLSSPYEEPVPAQQNDIQGCWENGSGIILIADGDQVYAAEGKLFERTGSAITDGMLSYENGEKIKFFSYKDKLYQVSGIFEPSVWNRFEPSEPFPLNGNYNVYTYPEKYYDLDLELENSKGTAKEVVEEDGRVRGVVHEAEITGENGSFAFVCGENTYEYTDCIAYGEYIYFYNDSEAMVLKNK